MTKSENIQIEQNTISRDWDITYKGKRYFVNFTYSDGQTLLLCNRYYWEIFDEDGEEAELSEEDVSTIIEFCKENMEFEEAKEFLKR